MPAANRKVQARDSWWGECGGKSQKARNHSFDSREPEYDMTDGVRSHLKKRAFLAAYRELGNVRLACQAAQIGRSSHYRWQAEPDYAEEFEQAKEDAVDVLEAEARRRAVDGWEEPVGWYKGQAGGTVRRYSDVLLIFLLKGAAPDKYRDRVEVGGVLAKLNFDAMTDEQLSRISQGEHPYAVLAPSRDLFEGSKAPDAEIVVLPPGHEEVA